MKRCLHLKMVLPACVSVVMMALSCSNNGGLFNPDPTDDTLEKTSADHSTLSTKNPIILSHGMSGFDSLGPVQYWAKTADHLRKKGYRVYITQTSPFSSVKARVTENFGYNGNLSLEKQIERIVKNCGGKKAIMIGHSMGGLDARYLASPAGRNRSDLVAAVLTIGTPHRGSEVADAGLGIIPGFMQGMIHDILVLIHLTSPDDGEAAAFKDLSTKACYAFNKTVRNNPAVEYYSVSGSGDGRYNMNTALLPTWDLIGRYAGDNDGLVSVESGKWGHYLGTWKADHIDECGIMVSYNPLLIRPFPYTDSIAAAVAGVIGHYNTGAFTDDCSSPVYKKVPW